MTLKNQNNQRVTLIAQMIARLAALSLCIILTSCGANYHLKRAIAKDPTILQKEVVRVDTILITKERVLKDTLLLYKDTTIIQEQVKLKIKYIDNFINVEVDCPSDTIRFEKEIFVDRLVYKKEDNTKFFLALALAVAFALLYLIKVIKSL